jgi:tetratricopeptide (TPR) repeat protein
MVSTQSQPQHTWGRALALRTWGRASALYICAVALACGPFLLSSAAAAQTATETPPKKPAGQAKKPAPEKRPAASPAKSAAWDKLTKDASAAREDGRLEEAIALYAKAVTQRADWAEGHWYLGVMYYELDRHQEARDSFRRVIQLLPKDAAGAGDAWTMKGLCEFRLKNYDLALGDLIKGRDAGVPTATIATTGRYHTAALLNRNEEYEEAQRILQGFVLEGDDSPRIIELLGIAGLRLPMLPAELPPGRREQVMMAGRASYFAAARLSAAARSAFEELLRRYPETPSVHYAYGVFLLTEHPDEAIEQFKRELEIEPRHPWAKLQLAFEYIKRAEWEEAKRWATEAVAEAPNLFVARKALGQILLETGEIEGAISELEAGVRIAPRSPTLRFTLARAYRRAGRADDAEREQAAFARLSRALRTERGGAQSVGGIELDSDTRGTPEGSTRE